MTHEIQVWKPVAMVTLKDGEVVFIPAAQSDAVGEAANSGKTPLINLGDRWVSRFDITGIRKDVEPKDAWAIVLRAPRHIRPKLRDFIRSNEEKSGRTMTAQWAQGWLSQWLAEEEKENEKNTLQSDIRG